MAGVTFTLTDADVALVKGARATLEATDLDSATHHHRMKLVWVVLGEKHGFDPDTIEPHSDDDPVITAESLS